MVPHLFSERDEYFCRREKSSDVLRVKLRVNASFSIFLDLGKKSKHQKFPENCHGSAMGMTAALVNVKK